MGESLFSAKYVNEIYIPTGLLVFGTFIIKRDWVAYAAVIAAVLGALKYYNLRKLAYAAFLLGPCGRESY